jgi:hypothetical protein
VLVSVSHRNSLAWIKYSAEIAAEKRICDRKDASHQRALSPRQMMTPRVFDGSLEGLKKFLHTLLI